MKLDDFWRCPDCRTLHYLKEYRPPAPGDGDPCPACRKSDRRAAP